MAKRKKSRPVGGFSLLKVLPYRRFRKIRDKKCPKGKEAFSHCIELNARDDRGGIDDLFLTVRNTSYSIWKIYRLVGADNNDGTRWPLPQTHISVHAARPHA